MEILIEQGTPVVVWGAGCLLPDRFQNTNLAADTEGAEQVFYFCCYKVERCPSQPGKTEQETLDIIEEHKADYPNLSYLNLRFLLKSNQSCRLVPIEHPNRDGGYHCLRLDVRDNRRPWFAIPGNKSFEKAFAFGNDAPFDETSMLTAWFREGGTNECSNQLFTPKTGRKRMTEERIAEQSTESALRLLAPQEGSGVSALVEFEKKCRTLDGQWGVVIKCSLGSFARLLELNVDRSGNIGPLLDNNPTCHLGDSSLDNYLDLFGDLPSLHMERIDPSAQKAATTAGART
jgi:hypothetical protein